LSYVCLLPGGSPLGALVLPCCQGVNRARSVRHPIRSTLPAVRGGSARSSTVRRCCRPIGIRGRVCDVIAGSQRPLLSTPSPLTASKIDIAPMRHPGPPVGGCGGEASAGQVSCSRHVEGGGLGRRIGSRGGLVNGRHLLTPGSGSAVGGGSALAAAAVRAMRRGIRHPRVRHQGAAACAAELEHRSSDLQCNPPTRCLSIAAEAGAAGLAAYLAGVPGGEFGRADEGGCGVHEGSVVFASLVEAVRDVDAQCAEPGPEAVEFVVGGQRGQVTVELVEQGRPAGSDGAGPGRDLLLVQYGRVVGSVM
jgi:hypothetical protein